MDKQSFSEKLQEIADGIEKIAESLEASEYQAGQEQEKTAREKKASASADFGFGEIGAKPSAGTNPLLDFCLS